MYVSNDESNGYWDFWDRLDQIEGMECDTIAGLLDSIKGKLDGDDSVMDKYSGQIMARLFMKDNNPEAYGIRLPDGYKGETPTQMQLHNVSEAEYIVFEHGGFDYEQETETVNARLLSAIESFDYSATDYIPDNTVGRIAYFFHDPEKYVKRILPVKRKAH